MWPVLELTYNLFKTDAVDFLDEMLPALDNFISFGSDAFKARADYRHMMLDIYQTSLQSEQLGENDRINGCKIAESLLLNLRGHVDDILAPIVNSTAENIDKAQTGALRLHMLEVLINAVLYAPAQTLQLLEQRGPGGASAFLQRWFGLIGGDKDRLPRVHDKKLSLAALCALMELEPSQTPDGLQGIVAAALRVFRGLPAALARRKAAQDALNEYSEDDESEQDMVFGDAGEEDGDVWDEDSAYVEMLAQEGQRLRAEAAAKGSGAVSDAEDDSDGDDELEEELGYVSPLEGLDVHVRFREALESMQGRNAGLYAVATTALSVDEQTYLMEIMREAQSRSA